MKVFYNNAYRFLHGLPKSCSKNFMFAMVNVPYFQEIMKKCQISLIEYLINSLNSIISALSEPNLQLNKLSSHWNNTQHVQLFDNSINTFFSNLYIFIFSLIDNL